MRQWIIDSKLAGEEEVDEIQRQAKSYVKDAKNRAWKQYIQPVKKQKNILVEFYDEVIKESGNSAAVVQQKKHFDQLIDPLFADIVKYGRQL